MEYQSQGKYYCVALKVMSSAPTNKCDTSKFKNKKMTPVRKLSLSLIDLPFEMWFEIISWLDDPVDSLHLSLCAAKPIFSLLYNQTTILTLKIMKDLRKLAAISTSGSSHSEFARIFAFHTGLYQTHCSERKTGDIEKPIAMIEKAVKGIRNQLTRFESIPSFEKYWATFLRVVVAEKGHEIATALYEKLFKRIKLTKVESGLYDYERTFQYASVFYVGKLVLENTYKNEDFRITMNRMDLLELGDYQLTTNQTTLQQLKDWN